MRNGWIADRFGNRRHYKNNKIHRDEGPAVYIREISISWYKNGQRHREEGPATLNAFSPPKWFRAGCKYGISKKEKSPWIRIGRVYKKMKEWVSFFDGEDDFCDYKRGSKEFNVLIELWHQFNKQCDSLHN